MSMYDSPRFQNYVDHNIHTVCFFVYSRAIVKNQDLKPETPISNIWYDDFWGTPLRDSGSHKSYRPFVVLTFRLNYAIHKLSPGKCVWSLLLQQLTKQTTCKAWCLSLLT